MDFDLGACNSNEQTANAIREFTASKNKSGKKKSKFFNHQQRKENSHYQKCTTYANNTEAQSDAYATESLQTPLVD